MSGSISIDKQTLLLAHRMLLIASNKFAHHGCNDLDKETLKFITDEDYLCNDLREWNNPSEEWPDNIHQVGDSSLMYYLSDKLKEAVESFKPIEE